MPEIEAHLRTLCRFAEQLGVVAGRGSMDYLHAALADVAAAHVGELKRTELVRLYQSIRAQIESAFTESLKKPNATGASEVPDAGSVAGG
jgi:hypothetical protein